MSEPVTVHILSVVPNSMIPPTHLGTFPARGCPGEATNRVSVSSCLSPGQLVAASSVQTTMISPLCLLLPSSSWRSWTSWLFHPQTEAMMELGVTLLWASGSACVWEREVRGGCCFPGHVSCWPLAKADQQVLGSYPVSRPQIQPNWTLSLYKCHNEVYLCVQKVQCLCVERPPRLN